MVKALSFKGDKKTKKRKREVDTAEKFGEASAFKEVIPAAREEPAADDDSWVTAEAVGDVVGPILFVLPTEPPSCIACDTTGKVFTMPLENMIEDNPATAEPHDVRQVWIANKVVGTETFTFKGHHGRQVLPAHQLKYLTDGADIWAATNMAFCLLAPRPCLPWSPSPPFPRPTPLGPSKSKLYGTPS